MVESVGFEALARWQHPQRGYVCPEEFIALAEETGTIVPFGWWILQEVCYQLKEWQLRYNNSNLTVGVNISQKQFSQPRLIDSLSADFANYWLRSFLFTVRNYGKSFDGRPQNYDGNIKAVKSFRVSATSR